MIKGVVEGRMLVVVLPKPRASVAAADGGSFWCSVWRWSGGVPVLPLTSAPDVLLRRR